MVLLEVGIGRPCHSHHSDTVMILQSLHMLFFARTIEVDPVCVLGALKIIPTIFTFERPFHPFNPIL